MQYLTKFNSSPKSGDVNQKPIEEVKFQELGMMALTFTHL